LQVLVDGEIEFSGRVIPGGAYPFVGATQVEVLTGNGAGIQIFYNGADLGTLGNFGQVVSRIFTQQGIVTATPTITLTPAPTDIVTATQPAISSPGQNPPTVPPLP
jgi:hypothetical protein